MQRPGLTMIELTLVLGLVVMVSAISVGWYSRFLTQNAVSDTADYLVETLRQAQIYTTSGKYDSNWGVSYAAPVITMYAVGTSAYNETYTVNSNISISGLTSIEFSGPAGTPNTTASIVVSGNNTSKTITVNSAGTISR